MVTVSEWYVREKVSALTLVVEQYTRPTDVTQLSPSQMAFSSAIVQN